MNKIYSAILEIDGNNEKYWLLRGGMVSFYANRVILSSRKSGNDLRIPINPRTTEDILWLKERFDISIQNNEQWNDAVGEMQSFLDRVEKKIEKGSASPSVYAFHGTLKEFQKEGLDFLLKTNGNALLADEMGLGKGVQTLAYLASAPGVFPALIVSPLTVLEHWNREISRFLTSEKGEKLRVQKIRESGENLRIEDADIFLINYDIVHRNKEQLLSIGLKTVVLDEIQGIRHSGTLKKEAIDIISDGVQHRIGLSGTPIHNYAAEIYNIIDWVSPGFLGSYSEFLIRFFSPFGGGIPALKDEISRNIMKRRRKMEVVDELPPKNRVFQVIDINKTKYERLLSEAVNGAVKGLLENTTLEPIQKKKILMDALDQLPETEREIAALSKLDSIKSFIAETVESDEPLAIYCHHRAMHQELHDMFYWRNPASIIGGQTDEARQENIDAFQKGKTNMMIAGLRAGSLGINLTTAHNVLFAELDWTPAIHWQAEDRLHRIGQQSPVFAYYLIGKGTLDEKIAEVLAAKAAQFEFLFNDTLDGFMDVKIDAKRFLLEKFLNSSDLKAVDEILHARAEMESEA